MSNTFTNKPNIGLHLLSLKQQTVYAFDVLDSIASLVSDGIEDMDKLEHNKELIKNSILFIYRELKTEPGKSLILNNHLNISSEQKFIEYLDSLSLILMSLANFSDWKNLDINMYTGNFDKIKPSELTKVLEAKVSMDKEKTNEYLYYLSELDSINNDIRNGTNFKKIKYYDIE